MQNLLEELKDVLTQEPRYLSDGNLLKNKIVEDALKLEPALLKLLVANDNIRKHFFVDIEKMVVFDKVKFQEFVSNKVFLPDSYTAFKNKIGLNVDGKFIKSSNDVVLSWAYKDCILEGGMTKEEVKGNVPEIFYNETLAPDEVTRLLDPKVLTNFQFWDKESVKSGKAKKPEKITHNDNLLIKGNNLLALHSLKKLYAGRVKLIYIDPPYNTGNDGFRYNDSFNHSSWLTFMKNRLEVAKEFLAKDGVIFVQCDDNEHGYLKILMDEVFKVDNFINNIAVRVKSPSGFKTVNQGVFEASEYILLYGKNRKEWKYTPQYVEGKYDVNYKFEIINPEAPCSLWQIGKIDENISNDKGFKTTKEARDKLGKTVFNQLMAEYALRNCHKVFRPTEINNDAGSETLSLKKLSQQTPDTVLEQKREGFESRYILNGNELSFYKKKVKNIDGKIIPTNLLTNIWTDIAWEGISNEGQIKLKQGKKPEKLLRRIIQMATVKGDIVLDFFSGSGTTPSVAHKMGRRWIAIEQMNYIKDLPEARLKKVIEGEQGGISKDVNWQGGGSFVYCELKEWNEEFVKKIHNAKKSDELIKIYEEMKQQAFFRYDFDYRKFDSQEFKELSFAEQQKALIDILDKNHLYVNYSEIEDKEYKISDEDKKLSASFYGGN